MMRKAPHAFAALPTLTSKLADEQSRKLELLLYGLGRLLRRRFNLKARGLRLSRAQSEVLLQLRRNEGISQTCVAQLLDVKPVTLGRLIDTLQRSGFIERRPDPRDRRVWLLNLTPAARCKLAQVHELGEIARSEAFSGLSPAEVEQAVLTLQIVKRNLMNGQAMAGWATGLEPSDQQTK